MGDVMPAYIILVDGVVQGVGFRPFVYRMAYSHNLRGYVKNLGDAGVEIFIEGRKEDIELFIKDLKEKAPPLARVENLRMEAARERNFENFEIRKSSGNMRGGDSIIPPDVGICKDCLHELFDPENPRYLYPFIVCTNCGPRFSIIEELPYDRENTSMREFPMCDFCREEYEDPLNRRYHAEPICCDKCGPHYSLLTPDGKTLKGDPLKLAANFIDEGKIIAIKGIGGFHIGCDATNEDTVRKLRKRLRREQQPFAIMVKDIETVEKIAEISPEERVELESYRKPIVLLKKKSNGILAESIAPGLHTVGIMLPYAGVHHILFHYSSSPAYVMTSANYPDMPMVKDNDRIGEIRDVVDYFLAHNRRIVNRIDDSVIRFVDGKRAIIRRSRGFVPLPLEMKYRYKGIAMGAELMNSFSFVKGRRIYPSQYIGNTSKLEVMEFMKDAIHRFEKILKMEDFELVVVDSHPLYNTSKYGREIGEEKGIPVLHVQHHYAHIATIMIEHPIDEIIGIAMDGVGYGSDAATWGGEIIYLGEEGVRRLSHISYYPLPGGDLAAYYPIRSLLGIMWKIYKEECVDIVRRISPEGINSLKHGEREVEIILQQLKKGINITQSSSTGRFLDAMATLLNIAYRRTYEGEPAMKLESVGLRGRKDLEFEIPEGEDLMFEYFVPQVIEALKRGERIEDIAYSLHLSIARVFALKAMEMGEMMDVKNIGVSGGVAYNHLIVGEIRRIVEREGYKFYVTSEIPRGDNGISAGQAYLGGMYLLGILKKEVVR